MNDKCFMSILKVAIPVNILYISYVLYLYVFVSVSIFRRTLLGYYAEGRLINDQTDQVPVKQPDEEHFLKSYLHKVDTNSHPSRLYPLCNTHHLFNFTHIHTTLSPLDLWTDPAGVTALLAGGPQAGRSDSPH